MYRKKWDGKKKGKEDYVKRFVTEQDLKARKDLKCTARKSRMVKIVKSAFDGYIKLSEMANPAKFYYKIAGNHVTELWCKYGWKVIREL